MDTSIAMGFKPIQVQDPMNRLAQMMQMDQADQANKLNSMKMDEYSRGKARSNNLLQLMGQLPADATDDQRISTLKGGGYFDEADKLQTGLINRQKNTAEVKAKEWETKSKQLDTVSQAFGHLDRNPDPQIGASIVQYLAKNGIYDQQDVDKDMAFFGANPPPEAIKQYAQQIYTRAIGAKDQLPKLDNINAGGYNVGVTTNPITGVRSETGRTEITQSADNKATVGASLANAAATREVAKATRDAANTQRDQQTEMKLADDYRAQSKDFKAVGDAYRQINSTLDLATKSPAATLAAATKFMKLLDPGSVVRESELGMALAASGVFDRATNYVNTLHSGKVLTANQVKDFKNITQQIYAAAQDGQKQVDAFYNNQAKTYNLRPAMVVQDLGQNKAPALPPVNPQGWALHVDANGNKAYVSPDGKQIKEVK